MFLTRPVRVTKVPAQLFLCGCFLLTLAGILLCLGRPNWRNAFATAVHPPGAQPLVASETKSRVMAKYSDGPIAFERNEGQTNPQVKFLARGHGYTAFLTPSETVVSLSGAARPGRVHSLAPASANRQVESLIRMQLVGANPKSRVTGEDQLPGISNYFIGNDLAKWRTAIPRYARVSYHDVYPGVDLAFHGAQEQLEFDLLVSPGVSPDRVALKFSGMTQLGTDASGGLVVSSPAGDLRLHKPLAYQENNGLREPVDARFVVKDNNQVVFALAHYDSSRQLVIDPTVSYATYLGGTGDDQASAVAVDSNGNLYITGETAGLGFPTTTGTYHGGTHDAFVTKLDPTKSGAASLVYSTFIGGLLDDSGNGIAVDATGNAYIAGGTLSTDLPTTTGVFQTTSNGGEDAFVAKLSSTGAITYLTYLGGNSTDFAQGIAVDSSGNAYVAGQTQSTSLFPTTNGFQTALNGTSTDAFVTVLNSKASAVTYSTYLGGSGNDLATAIAVDQSAKVYVTGQTLLGVSPFPTTTGVFQTTSAGAGDAFVSKFDPTKSGMASLVYSTYLGGAAADAGNGIAVDSSGAAYITGLTQSSNFPKQNAFQSTLKGAQDAFVTKLNAAATALVYSTYLGGSGVDFGFAIAVDGAGDAYITGQTSSTDFPTQAPTQSALNGPVDAFVAELNSTGSSLAFSTFLGGSGSEDTGIFGGIAFGGIAVDAGNNIYAVGSTASVDFPVTSSNALQTTNKGANDAFAAKITAATPSAFTLAASAPTPNPVGKGSSATATITASAQSGFSSTIALTCSAPTGITCSLNPTSVTPSPAAPSPTSILTINVSSTASLRSPNHNLPPLYALWLLIPGLAVMGAGLGSLRSRNSELLAVVLGCLVLAGLVFQMACSSGSSPTQPPGPTPYTVTVTGTGAGQTGNVAVSGSFQ